MEWTKYETHVVGQHAVAIVGWPFEPVAPLDNLSAAKLERIVTAIRDKECKWVKLTEGELAERKAAMGEDMVGNNCEARKRGRKHATQPSGTQKATTGRSASIVPSDMDDDDD